jgi:membrane protease YdiL (CAAX protease family)
MKRALALYLFGIVAVALAIWQPILGWLSPATFLLVFPAGAIWLWRGEGRSFQDLGLRRDKFWRRSLIWGLMLGALFPVIVVLAQALSGWIGLTPRVLPLGNLAGYIALAFVKTIFIVAIEEFVSRGYFLQRFTLGIGAGWAVLLSSVLWGIGHLAAMVSEGLPPFSIVIGMLTFIAWGTALSISCLRTTQSLWMPFGLHYGVNVSFSLLGTFFITSYQAPQWWIGNPAWAPESGVLGTLAWLLMIGIVWKITQSGK